MAGRQPVNERLRAAPRGLGRAALQVADVRSAHQTSAPIWGTQSVITGGHHQQLQQASGEQAEHGGLLESEDDAWRLVASVSSR